MQAPLLIAVVLAAVIACAADAAAQVIQPPPRSTTGLFGGGRPADPDRAASELTVTLSLLGGYEDNISPQGGVPTDPLAPRLSGSNGIFSTNIRYRFGTTLRFFEANAGGFMNSFRNLGIRAMYGGDAGVRASTRLGSRTGITAAAGADYQPSFMIRAGGPVTAGAGEAVPPTDPTAGISEMRSLSGNATSTVTHDWNPRQHSEVAYAFSRYRVRTDVGVHTQGSVATLRHTWDMTRSIGLIGSYQFSAQSTTEASGTTRPVDAHTGQLGLRLTKAVSPTRRLVFTGGGGAMRVSTLAAVDNRPFEYVAPSGYGGARMDLGRTWAVSADLRRDVTVLEGLTTQSFLTNHAALWLGGNVGRSWELALNGTYSNGRPHQGETGSFEVSSGTAQIQYGLTRWCSLVTSYGYYVHRLRDLSRIPQGFPNRFTRSTVSAGVSVWLPLFGAFPMERRPRTGQD